MTRCDLPSYLMVVRASAPASNSGSYNSTAHAPACIQAVKLGGACSGSSLSPARKLLRLSFAGSWFIRPYMVYRSLRCPRTVFPSKTDRIYASLDSLRGSPFTSAYQGGTRVGAATYGFSDSGQDF